MRDCQMMTFFITIENSNEYFAPGQSIVGKVYCSSTHPSSMEITVTLYGEECTYNTQPTKRIPTTWNRSRKNIFFKSKDTLTGSGFLNTTTEHNFPFLLTLPLRLPSRYLGKYGYVKYFVKAETTSYSGKIQNEDEIKVISLINLNDLMNVSPIPNTYSRELMTSKWFCLPELLDMEVQLNKNAFIVGETINISVNLYNFTSMAVSAILIELHNQVEAKAPPPNWKFLTARQLLTEDRGPGIGCDGSNKYFFHLKIPDDAEIPNFENCTLLKQKGILEVIAVFEDSKKPALKIKVDLILGHYFSDKREEFLKVRRPIEISISDSLSQLTQIPVLYPPSQNSSRSSIEQLNVGPNPIPPYPVDSKSKLPFNGEEPIVSVPEAKQFPPLLEKEMNLPPSNPFPYPKESNVSSTPYPTVDPFPHPRQNSKQQPYSTVGDISFPREESKDLLPYPKEDKISSAPYYFGSSLPYPKENSGKSRQSYPTITDPSYSRQESKDTVPYPKEDHFSSAPYPTGSSPPYSIYSSGKSRQSYLTVADPPYPREESKDRLLYPKKDHFLSALYPPESSCPYPIENDKDVRKHKINALSSSVLTYPREGEEEAPLLHTAFTDKSELPTNMPMLLQSLQKDIAPYSRKIQAPYPPAEPNFSTSETADFPPPTSGNIPPYLLEQPPIHSTLGFAKFTSMPMPLDTSSITRGTIGFAVPTSKPLHSTKYLETEDQPSAPLLSDMKTPPIAEPEELGDLLFIDTGDEVPKTEDSELNCSRQSGEENSRPLDAALPSHDEVRQSSKEKKKRQPKRELLLAS